MTVSRVTSSALYEGDGLTTIFPFTFQASGPSTIYGQTIEDGVVVDLPLEHYNVAMNVDGLGGEFVTSLPSGAVPVGTKLYIYRSTPRTQQVAVTQQVAYDPRVVEGVWDKLTFAMQEMYTLISRALISNPDTSPSDLVQQLLQAAADASDSADAANAAAEEALSLVGDVNVTGVLTAGGLAALDHEKFLFAKVKEINGDTYEWDSADRSWQITIGDPRYIAPDFDATGASGAWVRSGSRIRNWVAKKWPGINGSLYDSSPTYVATRTGGYGTYGLVLAQLKITAEVPAGQFDCALTGWASGSRNTGGNTFGGWIGANSPFQGVEGHAWTGGSTNGLEVNSGNRWGDFGLQADITGVRQNVGLQIVPDVVPDETLAPPVDIFPGAFALAFHKSIHGHKWWTGLLNSLDSLMPGGIGYKLRGGSILGNAPFAGIKFDQYFTSGIDLTEGIFSANTALALGATHSIRWVGGGVINGASDGLGITTGTAVADGGLYANNFTQAAIRWNGDSGVPKLRFFGAGVPVGRPTVTGSRGGNAALASVITALAGLGLVLDSTTAQK